MVIRRKKTETKINASRPRPRPRRPLSEHDADTIEMLAGRFERLRRKGLDPYEAAEKAGCEIKAGSDGAPELFY